MKAEYRRWRAQSASDDALPKATPYTLFHDTSLPAHLNSQTQHLSSHGGVGEARENFFDEHIANMLDMH